MNDERMNDKWMNDKWTNDQMKWSFECNMKTVTKT